MKNKNQFGAGFAPWARPGYVGPQPSETKPEEGSGAEAACHSPLSVDDCAQSDALILGYDREGHAVQIGDFRAQGYKLFARLTCPSPEGEGLIRALSIPTDEDAELAASLGQDYAEIARASLSVGNDPAAGFRARVDYCRAVNEARTAAGGRPAFAPKS